MEIIEKPIMARPRKSRKPKKPKARKPPRRKAGKPRPEQPPRFTHWVNRLREMRQRFRPRLQGRMHVFLALGLVLVALAPWLALAVPRLRPWAWRGLALWGLPGLGWSLALLWAAARLLFPNRLPWSWPRWMGLALLPLWMQEALAPWHPLLGGQWGQAMHQWLRQGLGPWGAAVWRVLFFLLLLRWLWERPLWDVFWLLARRVRGLPWPRWREQGRTWLRRARSRWQARRPQRQTPEAAPRTREKRLPPVHAPAPPPAVKPGSRAWQLPDPKAILQEGEAAAQDQAWAEEQARKIEETLAHFGIPARVVAIEQGPTVTRFGIEPGYLETRKGRVRVRVAKIVALADDLALALAAKRLRVQAPVPGRPYLGIEVPNESPRMVPLLRVLRSPEFARLRGALPLALGEDVAGRPVVAALETMPHLLIAGATGAGKSVCLHAMLVTWLLFRTPEELRLLLVDPKRVELTAYNGIPHLLTPVVTDLEKAQGALQWAIEEMERRYKTLAQAGVRSIAEYNQTAAARGAQPLPYIVVVIDELADLMMLAPQRTEQALIRLAQLARATGIHLVVATQRPSVDVVTGLIKANFPARIAFAVASTVDSRVILDRPGAERLLGRGDMLFLPPDAAEPIRVQGSFVTSEEVQKVVAHWHMQGGPQYAASTPRPKTVPLKTLEAAAQPRDPLLEQAAAIAREEGRVSITLLQRRLGIGYTRAARLYEQLRARGLLPSSPNAQDAYNEADAEEKGETD